jgi:DNA ligase-1
LTKCFEELISKILDDLVPIYLCTGKIAPAHEGIELGVGEALIIKSIAEVTGKTTSTIKKSYQEQSDLGTVAQTAKSAQKTLFGTFQGVQQKSKVLTIRGVLDELRSIVLTTE